MMLSFEPDNNTISAKDDKKHNKPAKDYYIEKREATRPLQEVTFAHKFN